MEDLINSLEQSNSITYAKVVVDLKSDFTNELYDYIIPAKLVDFVGVGSRVIVPFGKQDIMAYVLELDDRSEYAGTAKEIKDVLDYDQELSVKQIAIAYYISETYNVSLVSVLELMIPSFLKGQMRKYIEVKDYDKLHPDLALLFNGKSRLQMNKKLMENIDLIRNEIKKNNINLDYDLYTYGNGLKKREYYINESVNIPFKSEKRKNIYDFIEKHPKVTEDEIITYIDCTYNIIREMCKDDQIKFHEVPVIDDSEKTLVNKSTYNMTYDEKIIIERYNSSKKKKFLLHSNNEEFKLNFYMSVIEACKKDNKPVLITAPTIMLEEEILMYLKRYMAGYKIYGMSSKNTKKERYEVFMNAKYDNLDVLVTTHNGIFMPFNNLGAIIIAEEENPNYINENYPYYDSIDVLEREASLFGANVILSSASPSIKTYYKATIGEYNLLTSYKEDSDLENKIIVDMKSEILNGSSSNISNRLKLEIEDTLAHHKQVMLLVSSKAYSGMIRCNDCFKILKCPKCQLPLTYSKDKGYAKCNYCDYKQYEFDKCSCGSTNVTPLSFGEEKISEELAELFPNAKILDVNADLMKTTDDYNRALNDIEEGNVDIIIGTNILSKRLNNDNITLFGIIDTDMYLNSSNYHANEYTYNLISKINNKNKLVIQTYYPDNKIIKLAMKKEYETFYKYEIENRKVLNYDPFMEINRIIITGDFNQIYHYANYFKKAYSGILKTSYILGPTYETKYRGVKLILKHNNYELVKKLFNDVNIHFKKERLKVSFERVPKVL